VVVVVVVKIVVMELDVDIRRCGGLCGGVSEVRSTRLNTGIHLHLVEIGSSGLQHVDVVFAILHYLLTYIIKPHLVESPRRKNYPGADDHLN
jgi:hypothetical protein